MQSARNALNAFIFICLVAFIGLNLFRLTVFFLSSKDLI